MESPRRRIEKIESQVQGDEIELFEELMAEINNAIEADKLGIPYTMRPLSPEVARTLDAALAELREDPQFQHIFADAAERQLG